MLTGLIIAAEEAPGGAALRAELPVAGQTVLEQQARLLVEAGAERVIAIAAQLPPGLAAAAARLRRDQVPLEVVRQVDDVAQRVRPDDRVLLLGDGVVIDPAALDLILRAPAPAILVLPDTPETRGWELIDATARWAGVMLVEGDLIRRTALMLGEWDLQSTLLRNAIQAGSVRVDVEALGPAPLLAQVADPEAALATEQAISRMATRRHTGLLDRYVFDPLARLLAPRAMAAMIDPAWLRGGAGGLTILATLVLLGGWGWAALLLAMLAGPVDTLGRHLSAMTLRSRRGDERWSHLRNGASVAALAALGWHLARTGSGWGTLALATATLGFMTALFQHERWIGRPARRPLWLAETDTLTWMLAPFAIIGWWPGGLLGQAALAFASLMKVQRLTRRQP